MNSKSRRTPNRPVTSTNRPSSRQRSAGITSPRPRTAAKESDYKHEPEKLPNYFIGIRIKNSEIEAQLKQVQLDLIEEHKEDLSDYVIPTYLLRLHMMEMRLETDKHVEMVTEMLDDVIYPKVLAQYDSSGPFLLDVCGIGTYDNEHVFAKVKVGPTTRKLHKIVDEMKKLFAKRKIYALERDPFTPVMKIFQLPPMIDERGLRRKISQIGLYPTNVYRENKEKYFGTFEVTSLQMCSLTTINTDGYYEMVHEVLFG